MFNVYVIYTIIHTHIHAQGFPGGSDSKESTCNVGDPGSIPGSESPPGGGHGTPLPYSCLENPTDRAVWQVTVPGAAKSQT